MALKGETVAMLAVFRISPNAPTNFADFVGISQKKAYPANIQQKTEQNHPENTAVSLCLLAETTRKEKLPTSPDLTQTPIHGQFNLKCPCIGLSFAPYPSHKPAANNIAHPSPLAYYSPGRLAVHNRPCCKPST